MTKRKKRPTRKASIKQSGSHFHLPGGKAVKSITAVVILLGLVGSGYLGFDTFMKGYHAAYALAGDVKQQVDGLKSLFVQSQKLMIQTQINGLRTERRVLQRQVGDVRLRMKKLKEEDRAVFQHIFDDLEGQVQGIDGQIGILEAKLKK